MVPSAAAVEGSHLELGQTDPVQVAPAVLAVLAQVQHSMDAAAAAVAEDMQTLCFIMLKKPKGSEKG